MNHEPSLPENNIFSESVAPAEFEMTAEPAELPSFDELPEWLGYIETTDLVAARAQWLEAIREGSHEARELAGRYQELAEAAEASSHERFLEARRTVTDWLLCEAQDDGPEDVLATAATAGFIETPAMRVVRARIRLAITQPPTDEVSGELAAQIEAYSHLANQVESAHGAKYQLGLLLAKAMVWRDAGKPEFFAEDLEDIRDYVANMSAARGAPFTELEGMLSGLERP